MRSLFISLTMLFCTSMVQAAEPVTFKDWAVGSGEGFVYAVTVNNAENLFGQFCYYDSHKCFYMIGFDAACNPGDTYPVLVNTNLGAVPRQIMCDARIPNSPNYRYFINYDDIDEVINNAKTIGFAIPMQGDQFRAIRFSLDGATDAGRFMLKVFNSTDVPRDAPKQPEKPRDNATF